MTVTTLFNGYLTGLSTDTKPTSPSGYRFYETDLGDELISDGTYWWLRGYPSLFSTRKIGWGNWGRTVTQATGGLLNDWTAHTGTLGASNNTSGFDSTNGKYTTLQTGTTTAGGGSKVNVAALTIRKSNPRIRIRFQLVELTNHRLWMGFMTNLEPTGDTAFNAGGYAFALGISTTLSSPLNANFVIWHAPNTTVTSVDDTGTAFDGNVHTVYLVGDDANSRFSWKLDSGSYNHVTTNIPTQSGSLTFVFMNENTDSLNKSFRIYDFMVQSDK